MHDSQVYPFAHQILTCPACWQEISLRLAATSSSKTIHQTCPECAQSIRIDYQVKAGTLVHWEATPVKKNQPL